MELVKKSEETTEKVAFITIIGALSQTDNANITLRECSNVNFANRLITEKAAERVNQNEVALDAIVKDIIYHCLETRAIVGRRALCVFVFGNQIVPVVFAVCLQLFALIRHRQVTFCLRTRGDSQIDDSAATRREVRFTLHGKTFR
ncbi:hypothetical protein Q8W37_15415 [Shimia thalassica]|nr:hypothetical protein [Shimia thalassica]MDP2581326.1 hypothetical protein [Shimia thalassica]